MSFEIIPGDPFSSVIVHVPHSSTHIPDDVRAGIVLDDHALADELAAITDAETDLIAIDTASAAAVRPWLFINRTSRLVIDPERFPDDREELNAVGMGAVYEHTTTGAVLREPTLDQRESLLQNYFHPYAAAIAELVAQRLTELGEVTIVDLHSFPAVKNPYELHGDGERPEICIGTDPIHTPRDLAALARESFSRPAWRVGVDTPFRGTYVPLFAFDSQEVRVWSVMVELRRDMVARDRPGLTAGLQVLLERLARP